MNNFLQNILNKKKQRGFTLIELMVSISIFISIMLAAMGSLIISSNAAKEAKALRIAMDNVNFAMENMTRNLRMGDEYYCLTAPITQSGQSLPTGMLDCTNNTLGNGIVFTPAELPSSRYAYQLNGTKLQKCTPDCVDITSSAVNINYARFTVRGSSKTDNVAPSVYIVVSGSVTVKGKIKTFAIQTMAAQRSNE